MTQPLETWIPPAAAPRSVSVRELLAQAELASVLTLRAGESGLERLVDHPRVQKSGLVLAGHTHGMEPTRVQVLGETELSFLEALPPDACSTALRGYAELRASCTIVTRGVSPPAALIEAADACGAPVLVSKERSSATINLLHAALDRLLAPRSSVHGGLLDVHGVGMLLVGPSGIGKSELALSLLNRGHRFVADDRVVLELSPSRGVVGRPEPLLRHHIEVRGIGILNVRDLFGATAVRDDCSVDVVIELTPWRDDDTYERLGVDDVTRVVLGVQVPRHRIPVRPGRDLATILEVAARNQLLKRAGTHGAREFVKQLSRGLGLPDDE